MTANRRHAVPRRGLLVAGLLGLPALAGCAVGPDFKAPAPPPSSAFLPPGTVRGQIGAQHFATGADIPGRWWDAFHSRPLTALVERAMAQNADLQAARAALRAARENRLAARGVLFPQVGANLNDTAGRVSDQATSPLASNQLEYSLATAQLTVSYTPDVFGLARRQIESADALALNQQYQAEAAYLTLTSNLVLAVIQEASLRGQIDATRKIISAETDLLKVLRAQKAAGQVAEADVLLQEAALAQVLQTLPPLEKAVGLQRDLITALSGQRADDQIRDSFDLASLTLPRTLPVSLPSALVEHRPDVLAASATLHSASALIGVAEANRLPVVSLSAQAGSNPANFANLFQPSTFFYTLAGNVAQTVFDGGTLLHKQKQATAEFDQAYAQYRSTVIVAFQNVADALRAIEADEKAERAAAAAERASSKSLAIAKQQLQLGAVSTIVVLGAQQTYVQATLTSVQARAARYADAVALFQALGGGWWNRRDLPPAKAFSVLDTVR